MVRYGAGCILLLSLPLQAASTEEWLASIRAADSTGQERLLLGYRKLTDSASVAGPRLLIALNEENPGVRCAAAAALGDVANGWRPNAVIQSLIRELSD